MRTGAARWGLVSGVGAPTLLIGGWTVAARRQPSFDSLVGTISDLARVGAADRWVMTSALAGLGVCHVLNAAALHEVAPAGRAVMAVGGVATTLVAVFPLPADGSSAPHTAAAATAFLALAAWPAVGWRRAGAPVVSTGVSAAAATGLLGLVGWFFAELSADSGRVGLAERCAAGAQALWPLAVIGILRASSR